MRSVTPFQVLIRFLYTATILLPLMSIAAGSACFAMSFDVITLKGEPAIIGNGEIITGDAVKLENLLIKANRHSLGYFALALNSPGGSVQAAFEMSKIIDKSNVNTYVPPGFKCVSACAAIVFIAGREHINIQGGLLGFHGCYDSITKVTIELCNEAIAQHSIEHGTAYGSVMAFIQHVPSDKVIWISGNEADCWAINRYALVPKPSNYEKCVFDAIRGIKKN